MGDSAGGCAKGSTAQAEKLREESARVVVSARALQYSAATFFSKCSAEDQSLRQRALSLHATIRSSSAAAASYKLEEELNKAESMITDGDVAWLLPSKAHGNFLKLFLGPISVRATRKDVQLKVKEENNKYRVDISPLLCYGDGINQPHVGDQRGT